MTSKRKTMWFFAVTLVFVLLLGYLSFFGIHSGSGADKTTYIKGAGDIRWGIDIQGGVEAIFKPAGDKMATATKQNIDTAKEVISQRLKYQNITDYEIYPDYNSKQLIVRFPWKANETNFDVGSAIQELGKMATLTFVEGAEKTGTRIMTGADVESAAMALQNNAYVVQLKLKGSGTQSFADATSRLAGTQTPISIWVDIDSPNTTTPISTASVKSAITGGDAVIEGNFTAASAKTLASQINSGALPFALEVSDFSSVSPTLGKNSLNVMLIAGIIAFVLVCIFVLLFYRLLGVVACIALLGQVALALAIVSGFFGFTNSLTMTLPGIAGIILSIGMGVDANIITSERIKEELRKGKSLDAAIKGGQESSFSAIFDGNITVIIVAIILMGCFGAPNNIFARLIHPLISMFNASTTGSIYAFGYTLLAGVIGNFLFGVVASRFLIHGLARMKIFRNPSLYGGTNLISAAFLKVKNLFRHEKKIARPHRDPHFDFMGKKKYFFIFSIAIMVIGVICNVFLTNKLSIEFSGGSLISYSYTGSLNHADVEKLVSDTLQKQSSVVDKKIASSNQQMISVSIANNESLTKDQFDKLNTAMTAAFGKSNNIKLEQNSNVSPTMGRDFLAKGAYSVGLAALIMIIYIAFRFRKISGWSAGVMATVALLHDVVMVYFAFVFFRMDIDANLIAVVLAILGWSLNDTVVIYDRIRENQGIYGDKMPLADLVNLSINQSLTRSINTAFATFMSVVVVAIVALALGMTSILSFAIPMCVGIVIGCYSTICIAGPLWVLWKNFRAKRADKKNVHKGKKAKA